MDKEETKREIQKLWIRWPDRKKIDDSGLAALSFYDSLKEQNEPILANGDYGLGDPYQIIHAWVLD